jgi:hypothetical protein
MTAHHHFRSSVNHLWSAWTGGLLDDKRAFNGIREALTELEEDNPATDPRTNAFRTAATSANEDWEKGLADEEDAMVRILDALLALDAAEAEVSR